MSSTRNSQRINNAIDSLIGHLVPAAAGDDDDARTRRQAVFDLVRALLEQPGSNIPSDVNHASDLIKRRLISTNPSQALRFSNLYTRLLALPVLNQKWAILYLLHQLADSPDPNEPLPLSPPKPQQAPQQLRTSPRPERVRSRQDDDEARDVAQTPRRLPERGAPHSQPVTPGADGTPRKTFTRDVSLKSTLLAANSNDWEPSERALLRDLPFTLQGLSSATLPFTGDDALQLPTTLPPPLVSLLHTLAEPSLLFRQLSNFVRSPARGLLGQSLRAAIGNELRSYLTLVATLEGQIRRALASLDDSAPRGGIGKAGVTLKRCVVWTREATMGLRLMSLIAEQSQTKHGGQLISLIHGFVTSHGDPVVAAFAERLLADVTRPFYEILRRWIYDGELSDPHLEFFVREQDPASQAREQSKEAKAQASVWNSKYEVVQDMVPSIITPDFAQKVFLIGKSLNFIRHSCGDSAWVDAYSKTSSKELRYGDMAVLDKQIDEAYKTTMRRLMHLMAHRFHIFDHLQALKNYILLGQGDFIALLMESLAANLDRPAGAQYRHTLTAQLEHAIRGSNAQYDSDEVLRRLDARMLQLSHGDIGWDCFTLEYKIDAPVDVVVTDWAHRQYLKMFNFLWRIKRVEFSLQSTWRKCMTGARGVLQTPDKEVQHTWKTTRGVLAEMIHFVGQLQYYILFEVIEASWSELQRNIRKEDCTLDDLITAHTKYLTAITHKGLLGARRRQFEAALAAQHAAAAAAAAAAAGDMSAQPGAQPQVDGQQQPQPQPEDRNSYMNQLSELLRIMLAYRDCVDGLYSWALADFTRRQEAEAVGLMRRAQQQQQQQPPQSQPLSRRNSQKSTSSSGRNASNPRKRPASSGGGPTPMDLDEPSGNAFTPGASNASSIANNSDLNASGLGLSPNTPQSELPALQERLKGLGTSFKTRLQVLLGDLAYQPDMDMRFLGVAMNFNDVYQPVRRKRRTGASGSGTVGEGKVDGKGGQEGGSTVLQTPAPGQGMGQGGVNNTVLMGSRAA